MDSLERLTALEDIRALKARYFRSMDTKDWDGFAEVFAPDAVMDMSSEVPDSDDPDAGITRGNKEIAAFVHIHVDDVTTVHHGHMPEIEILSPTTARGVWAMEDKLRWPEGSPIHTMHGYGHYHETYELVDGAWRISTLTLTRLRLDVEMGDS
jgi:SnoaL-like domain